MKRYTAQIFFEMELKLLFVFASILFYSCNETKQEVYYLPENYSGVILIFYNQANGVEPKTNGKEKVFYVIPKSGVLLVRTKGVYGKVKPTIFYIKKEDKDIELPYVTAADKIKKNGDFVFSYSSAEFVKEYGAKPIQYSIFLVGQKNNYDSLLSIKNNIDIEKTLTAGLIYFNP